MSMTKSRDRADATREAASTRRARPTGRGGPRFLPYSGVNQPSHGGTDTPTADPAGVRQASAGPVRPPTDVYQPSLGANPLRRAQPRLRAGVLHPFNYTTRKYVPQAHNLPPNGGRSRRAIVADFGVRPVASNTAVSLPLGSRSQARADMFGWYAPTRDPCVAARWPDPHRLGAIQCNMCGDTNTE